MNINIYTSIYIYIYLSAFGQRPRAQGCRVVDVWLVGCLLSCLLSGWHQTSPKSTKMGSKILPKSTKLGVKTLYDRSQDASWRGLRRSWVQDGPTRAPRAKVYKKPKHFHPPLGSQVGAKIHQKSILG